MDRLIKERNVYINFPISFMAEKNNTHTHTLYEEENN